jgi:hypothetical protein
MGLRTDRRESQYPVGSQRFNCLQSHFQDVGFEMLTVAIMLPARMCRRIVP